MNKKQEYNKAYYEKNKERLKEKQKLYNSLNKDSIKAKNKERYARNAEARRSYMVEYQKRNRPRLRAYMRLWRYGITQEEYDRMLKKQGGACGICKKHSDKPYGLVVDHNHQTNVIRGLLCDRCNVVLGMIEEDQERIVRISEWIKNNG